jgi:hypothetical protein
MRSGVATVVSFGLGDGNWRENPGHRARRVRGNPPDGRPPEAGHEAVGIDSFFFQDCGLRTHRKSKDPEP